MNSRAFGCALLVSVVSLSRGSVHTLGQSASAGEVDAPARWVILDSRDQEVGTVNGQIGSTAIVTLLVEGSLVRGWGDETVPPQPDRLMNFQIRPDGFVQTAPPDLGVSLSYPTPNCSGPPYFQGVGSEFVRSVVPRSDGAVWLGGEPSLTMEVRSIWNGACQTVAPVMREVRQFTSFYLADVAGHFVPPFRAVLIPLASTPSTPMDWTFCAAEGGVCAFTGVREVRYGANGSFVLKTLTDGSACINEVFGDPIYGTVKQCSIK